MGAVTSLAASLGALLPEGGSGARLGLEFRECDITSGHLKHLS